MREKERIADDKKEMNFAIRLSFLLGIFMLGIKIYAYTITGSIAILSDLAESVIHIFAVGFAAYSMWLSLKPADESHLYGHDKITFFSAGFEGAMIIIAALYILYESVQKILFGLYLQNVDEGASFMVMALTINLMLSLFLIRRGKKYRSLILVANGKHILTDCFTSLAVIVGLLLVRLTGIALFDPIVAILAAINILCTGFVLVRQSVRGLMDQADLELHKKIVEVLNGEMAKRELSFHHLRHRSVGQKIFIEFHLLFPKDIALRKAHDMACEIEAKLRSSIELQAEIFTHLEPEERHDDIHKKYGLPI